MTARALLTLTLCLAMSPSFAQSAPDRQPIEKRMTPAEFAAAGLDKLSAAELAQLNTWLGRTIEVETVAAAEEAKANVARENRGFLRFGSDDPIEASIVGEFRGFAPGRRYTLDNGQVWQQIDDATLAGVRRTTPKVRITPSRVGNSWFIGIDGYNTQARVTRIE